MAKVTKVTVAPVEKLRTASLRRNVWLARPHATAEAGLGTTVLGVLGLIMLPVAALGLILSGGALGWIIVGGLAALAVLVAYIDPFGQ
ncbi:solute carrier organic anion transporter [Hymenobacter sp. 5317J-9]|uniref:solute carrier organic anion transporter n=1 Tax=Hymenobacter sp. 5317J-9 TaxID=2932250 RepID=UPI001FD708BB|nr:solute carrier organic anion transporter [Hymenobacter sp. 5317J-9]UOQ98768.1 solute carrier organic anion transporter [Hymenobacter sp. 5317J-9]